MTTRGGTELLQALELSLSLSKVGREVATLRVVKAAIYTSVSIMSKHIMPKELTDPPARVGTRVASTTKANRGREAVIEAVCTVREAKGSQAGLTAGLVEDVDAVTPAVSAGDGRRLSIKTHAQATKTAELAHSSLRAPEAVDAHVHRRDGSAVHTAVDIATRREASCLEGQHLVRSELVLVERLLLLLQRLNLALDGDLLPRRVGIHTQGTHNNCNEHSPAQP